MNNAELNREFSTLAGEIKEQILYLQELGAENFSVNLPEIQGSGFRIQDSKFKIQDSKFKIQDSRFNSQS